MWFHYIFFMGNANLLTWWNSIKIFLECYDFKMYQHLGCRLLQSIVQSEVHIIIINIAQWILTEAAQYLACGGFELERWATSYMCFNMYRQSDMGTVLEGRQPKFRYFHWIWEESVHVEGKGDDNTYLLLHLFCR